MAAALAGVAVGVAVGVAGCTSPSATSSPPAPSSIYVSIGDSYAAGYQPTSAGSGRTTRNGFAYRVAHDLGHVALANFGCVGVTVAELLSNIGCTSGGLGPGGIEYPWTSQAAAALHYVADHRGHLAAITIVIGGNDVKSCFSAGNSESCARAVITHLQEQLTPFLMQLRRAAGPRTPIIGLTYPDIFLSAYLHGGSGEQIAARSVALFRDGLNPALRQAYATIGAKFVDVTAISGAYIPADHTTRAAGYGAVPTAVFDVCRFTFVCRFGDVHPTNAGYQLIADAVLHALHR